jgi:ABC-2 type transport system ATP-binding protein
MSETLAIEIRGLAKRYGKVEALRGLDLDVAVGEAFGFLGPNGAGKTTTIRCLLDLIRPDAGTARILGIDPQVNPVGVKARTGYLLGELHLNDNWTAERQLRFFSDLRGGQADWQHARLLAQRLDLNLSQPIKNLSKGNKQKVGVIQALMHRPPLLLLDEPSSGLDTLMQQEVLCLIQEARAAGATVFFSSHIMSEVEAAAGRVGIIREGQIVEVAETERLRELSFRQVHVHFRNAVNVGELASVPGVRVLSTDDGCAATLEVGDDMDRLVKALAAFPVADLEVAKPSLEEVFLAYYKNEGARKDSR